LTQKHTELGLQVIEIASYEWFNRLNLKRFFETVVVQQVPNSGVLRLSYSPTPFTAMKNILLLLVCSLAMLATQANAQSKPQSPPATTTATVNGKTITINYSQPSVKGRKIWGGLVPYGEVWRTGANESSNRSGQNPSQRQICLVYDSGRKRMDDHFQQNHCMGRLQLQAFRRRIARNSSPCCCCQSLRTIYDPGIRQRRGIPFLGSVDRQFPGSVKQR
jgi:hypothetical protein